MAIVTTQLVQAFPRSEGALSVAERDDEVLEIPVTKPLCLFSPRMKLEPPGFKAVPNGKVASNRVNC